MLLAIDIGNTNIVMGLITEQGDLKAYWRIATRPEATFDEYGLLLRNLLDKGVLKVKGVVLACVVPKLTKVFQEVALYYFQQKVLLVAPGTKTGIKLLVDNPKGVGADRIVNSVAAYKKYGGVNLCVIDLGTATTFDVVSNKGEFLGGAIAPGVKIAAESLHLKTAQLPQIALKFPVKAIGKDTVANLQSGLMFGYIGLIKELIFRFKQELKGEWKIILTGGLAGSLMKELKNLDVVLEDNLTLEGLKIIWDLNQKAVL